MIKFTQTSYDRLQELLTLAGYTIRHEKGNFKSGSCVIESGKLVVLNKFAPIEARITFLIDALQHMSIDESLLDERRLSFLNEVRKFNLSEEASTESDASTSSATDIHSATDSTITSDSSSASDSQTGH